MLPNTKLLLARQRVSTVKAERLHVGALDPRTSAVRRSTIRHAEAIIQARLLIGLLLRLHLPSLHAVQHEESTPTMNFLTA